MRRWKHEVNTKSSYADFLLAMQEARDFSHSESQVGHARADHILTVFIRSKGCSALADTFNEVKRYFASTSGE